MYDVLKGIEDHLILIDDITREETEMIQSKISRAKEVSPRAYQ